MRNFLRGGAGRNVIELAALALLLTQYWLGASGRWDGAVVSLWGYDLAVFLTFVAGRKTFWNAATNLLQFKLTGQLAVALAALAALYLGRDDPIYYFAAFEVIYIMRLGGFLEDLAVDKTRSAVAKLGELFPDRARVLRDGQTLEIPVEDLRIGDRILVNPGERVPADARIVQGRSSIDQSTLTGEPLPVDKAEGDEIFAGTLNLMGAVQAEVFAVGGESSLGRIIHLVEEAEAEKSPVEKAADRYAQYFVPIVLALAVLTYLISGDLVRSVSVLIIACPCAMVLATPTAVAAGIGRLALSGILVKGGAHVETLGRAVTLAIDKTGTLTRGRPRIVEVLCFQDQSETKVLASAATIEQRSEHPIGRILVEEARARGLTLGELDSLEAVPGRGVRATARGRRLLAGNLALMEEHGVSVGGPERRHVERLETEGASVVYIAEDGAAVGAIALGDELRAEAPAALRDVLEGGIGQILLLTGDTEGAARSMATRAGIAAWAAGLLPTDKVERIRQARAASKRPVAFLGDGVNDAPAMVAADVGIAMGEIGSDLTVDAADVVFTSDDLSKLPLAFEVGRKTMRTIHVNLIVFALCLNGATVAAAALGYVPPVWAAIIHQIASLLVVFNSLRLFFAGRWEETILGRWNRQTKRTFDAITDAVALWGRRFVFEPQFKPRGRVMRWGLMTLFIVYLASGWTAIQPNQIGLHLRFGKLMPQRLEPGLHFTLPRPIDRVIRTRPGEVRRVEIGFRSTAEGAALEKERRFPAAAAIEWESIHRSPFFEWVPDESLLLTGDENIVAATLILHYRLRDPAAYYLSAVEPLVPIRAATESALRAVAAESSMDALLVSQRAGVEEAILKRLIATIEPYGMGIEVLEIEIQEVHPPSEVVEAYREVASALEERSSIIHRADGQRNQLVPLARGEAATALAEADIFRVDSEHDAAGAAARFAATASALAHGNRRSVLTRRYFEALEEALEGRELFVRDDSLGEAYRLVLSDGGSAPLQTPALDETYTSQRRRP